MDVALLLQLIWQPAGFVPVPSTLYLKIDFLSFFFSRAVSVENGF